MKCFALILALAVLPAYAQQTRNAQGNLVAGAQPSSLDCSIDGSVVNSVTGEPIARARVILQNPGTGATTTDSSGRWALSKVGCSRTQVVASRPAFLARSLVVTLVSGSPVHDIKIELVPQSVVLGRIVDDQGDPVMGAQVVALRSRVQDGKVVFQRTGGVASNDLGEYRIAGLVSGRVIVCASLMNSFPRPDGMIFDETCYPGSPDSGASNAIDLPPGREMKTDFALNPVRGVHIRGTVTGLPEDRGVGLSLNRRRETGTGAISSSIRDGHFDFFAGPGSWMLMGDYFENGKHLLARVPVEIGSSDIDNLAVVMAPGFSITGAVRLQTQSQQPHGRIQFGITLHPSESTTAPGQAKWESDGGFSVNDMTPGTYRLDTFPPAPFYVKSATLAGQDILSGDFTVSQAAGPIEIVLADDGGAIEGDLVNSDGQPVPGGVLVLRNGKAATAAANPSSHFKLQNLPPGDYKAYAWDDPTQVPYADTEWMRRYAGSGTDVSVTSGQTSSLKLTPQTVPQ